MQNFTSVFTFEHDYHLAQCISSTWFLMPLYLFWKIREKMKQTEKPKQENEQGEAACQSDNYGL